MDVLSQLPGGVLVVNANSEIVSLNAFGCALVGFDEHELVGKRIDILLTIASRIYYQTHIYPLITLRKLAQELYLTLQTRQRVTVPILLNGRVAEPTDDGSELIYFSFMPVYQRRQYEQELLASKKAAEDALLRNDELIRLQQSLEANQAALDRQLTVVRQRNDELEQFGKIISHDLQEPLRKVALFAEMLTTENADSLTPTGQMALQSVHRSSLRLRQLISELQYYFTLVYDDNDVETVTLTDLVKKVAQEFSDSPVQFTLCPLPKVIGKTEELTSLFRHLFDNAVKFRQAGQAGVVKLTSAIVGRNKFKSLADRYDYADFVRITVSDNGIGFEDRHREDVFKIMKKLHPHTPGIGLGLAIAKKIVERHGGQITATSAPGKGTTITLLLPVAKA